jgi:hypothetical protein
VFLCLCLGANLALSWCYLGYASVTVLIWLCLGAILALPWSSGLPLGSGGRAGVPKRTRNVPLTFSSYSRAAPRKLAPLRPRATTCFLLDFSCKSALKASRRRDPASQLESSKDDGEE